MDIGLKTRKQVSLNLLNELEFMKCHRDLVRGLTRSRRGKLHSLKSWNSCAKKLNALKDGTTKDAKGWSKYWCDCKYRVRRRALELSVANENDRKPPDGVIPLSRLEEGVLSIIGDNAIDGVVIKTDPLAYDEEEHADYNMSNMNTATFTNNIGATLMSTRNRKRRYSSRDVSEVDASEVNVSEMAVYWAFQSSPNPRMIATNGLVKLEVILFRCDPNFILIGHSDDATEFLRLEKEKIENWNSIRKSVQTIASQITRMADIMGTIRDFLLISRTNI